MTSHLRTRFIASEAKQFSPNTKGRGIDVAENKNKAPAQWLTTLEGNNALKNVQFLVNCLVITQKDAL
jgi:hypothetical protein